MALERKLVLHLPLSDEALLTAFLENCLVEKVALIAIVGEGCEEMEEEVDWILTGGSTGDGRFITTSSHPGETVVEVLAAATNALPEGPASVVRF